VLKSFINLAHDFLSPPNRSRYHLHQRRQIGQRHPWCSPRRLECVAPASSARLNILEAAEQLAKIEKPSNGTPICWAILRLIVDFRGRTE
jgi:hypothetical protein